MEKKELKGWVSLEPKTDEEFDEVIEYLISKGYITKEKWEETLKKLKMTDISC